VREQKTEREKEKKQLKKQRNGGVMIKSAGLRFFSG
jgi:hypothetical protein